MNAMIKATTAWPLHARFDGPIVMIGFGSIGRGTLPLLERHIAFDRKKFAVIAPDDEDRRLLDDRELSFIHVGITKDNFRDVLTPLVTAGPGRGINGGLAHPGVAGQGRVQLIDADLGTGADVAEEPAAPLGGPGKRVHHVVHEDEIAIHGLVPSNANETIRSITSESC